MKLLNKIEIQIVTIAILVIAIALYQKLGYEQVGFRKRYYTNPAEGAVLMTRQGVPVEKTFNVVAL